MHVRSSIKHRKSITICFVGIDGSGKTTHASLLLETLLMQGEPVELVHFFSTKRTTIGDSWFKRINEIFVNNLDKPTSSRLKVVIKFVLRLASMIVDSWLTNCINVVRHKAKIIIYDRYYYDSLVIITSRYRILGTQVMVLSKLILKPDIAILLEVTPLTSVKRKPEHSISDAENMCNLYSRLKQVLPIKVVNAELSVKQVRQHVVKLCGEALK